MGDFTRVGSVGDFQEGLVRVFVVDGLHVAVVNHAGRFYAFDGRCPHAGYTFNYTRIRPRDLILCSSHFAWFELASGRVIDGPTDEDLAVYPVRVAAGEVLVSIQNAA